MAAAGPVAKWLGIRPVLHPALTAVLLGVVVAAGTAQDATPPPMRHFLDAGSRDDEVAGLALTAIAAAWKDSYTPMLIDLARLMPGARRAATPSPGAAASLPDDKPAARGPDEAGPATPASPARPRLIAFLERQTRQRFGDDLNRWRAWMWARPANPHPDYAEFKGIVYGQIDPRMREFFPPRVATTPGTGLGHQSSVGGLDGRRAASRALSIASNNNLSPTSRKTWTRSPRR
ncbi:MAG: hypothetical protein ABIX28_10505 [Vicinamibacterales bacterium]